ncbi:hypothetical protein NDU88_006118 [Pleurodeles waltl]|uniref:Uncharacterized protein n=1 Tax=Pleurodeles waltl TaxID=8319 RepID=A0AAV7MEV9_PLEWA|nr:hypothetical protein NDU88_006118 [Pleurodeles waltl]
MAAPSAPSAPQISSEPSAPSARGSPRACQHILGPPTMAGTGAERVGNFTFAHYEPCFLPLAPRRGLRGGSDHQLLRGGRSRWAHSTCASVAPGSASNLRVSRPRPPSPFNAVAWR